MRNYLIVPAVAFALAAASPALAEDDMKRLNVPREQWLPATQIVEKLGTQGYKVLEIETEDGAYEVKMVDKNGTRIKTLVHPATAEPLAGYGD